MRSDILFKLRERPIQGIDSLGIPLTKVPDTGNQYANKRVDFRFDACCNGRLPFIVQDECLHVSLCEVTILLEYSEVQCSLGFFSDLLGCNLGIVEIDEMLQGLELIA